MSRRRLSSRAPIEQPEADRLFAGLDHRRVEAKDSPWVAVVLGIHCCDSDIWIQVAPEDSPANGVVLHLSRWATVDHALAALRAFAIAEEAGPRVIPVMHLV